MTKYVTMRRWSLKEDADEAALIALVRDGIVPAYRRQPGCLKLALLRTADPVSYLALTYWESRAAFDAWAGEGGQRWRDEYRLTLERWLELMSFNEEWTADVLMSSDVS